MIGAASLFLAAPSVSMAATPLQSKEEIINFQKDHGLKPDGIIGKRTRAAIRAESKKKTVNIVDSPTEKLPVKPTVSVKKTAFRPEKIIKKEEKCRFLFWDVECMPPENTTTADLVETINPINSSAKTLEKGSSMIGMDAQKDHKTLENKLSNTFGYKIDPARIPWCAAWANTVLADLGVRGTDSLAARSFLNWGQAVKRPEEGDIVVFRRGNNRWAGHVGFYVKTVEVDGRQYVAVLGGNQARGVSVAYYDASRVLGYRKVARA